MRERTILLPLTLLPFLLGISSVGGGWTRDDTLKVILVAMFVLIMVLVIGALVVIRKLLIPPRHHRGRCPKCGYNLTGNTSGVCPECGTAVNKPDA